MWIHSSQCGYLLAGVDIQRECTKGTEVALSLYSLQCASLGDVSTLS